MKKDLLNCKICFFSEVYALETCIFHIVMV